MAFFHIKNKNTITSKVTEKAKPKHKRQWRTKCTGPWQDETETVYSNPALIEVTPHLLHAQNLRSLENNLL